MVLETVAHFGHEEMATALVAGVAVVVEDEVVVGIDFAVVVVVVGFAVDAVAQADLHHDGGMETPSAFQ